MGEVASASAFRKAFTSVEDTEKRKEVFQKYMGTYNETMFNLFKNKLIGEKMSEQLEIMKYLAGLLKEAPINFDADVDTGMSDEEDDEYATKPGYTQDNMINQLGKIIDSDDAGKEVDQMKIKKFTPVTKVTTDDNGSVDVSPAEAKALKSMMDMLSSARMGEEQSPREKFLDAIQTKKGLLNMIDFAYDKKIVQQTENFVAPDMNLDDIREDYDVRQDCHSKTHDCATKVIHPTWGEGKPMYESHAVPTNEGYVAWYDVEFAHGIEKEVPAEDMEIITLAEHGSSLKASKFKPHMMYDPKTGEGKMAKVEQDHLDMKAKGWGHEKPKKEESVEEGRMSDIHQDANSMDKEEFAKEHPMFADDWEGMQHDDNAEDEPRDDGSPAYKKYIGKNKKDESLESYNFIEEAEATIEDCIRKTLEKEGGAAGLGAIEDACNKAGFEENCEDAIAKMSDVKKHEHGDYILEGKKNCGCGEEVCITYGKQDESVEEGSEDSGEGSISDMEDDELMDYVGQREEDLIDDIQQHIAPDFLHKDNYEEMFEKYREEVLEPAANELSQEKAMDQMPDEMEMDLSLIHI